MSLRMETVESDANTPAELEEKKRYMHDMVMDIQVGDKICFMVKFAQRRRVDLKKDGANALQDADGMAVIMGERLDLIRHAMVLIQAAGMSVAEFASVAGAIEKLDKK